MRIPPSERPRSPVSLLVVGLAMFAGAYALWPANMAGDDLAGVSAAGLSLLGARVSWLSLNARDTRRRFKRAINAARRANNTHGESRLATRQDVKQEGMLRKGGFLLGGLDGREVYHNGEGSIFVFSPPGSGKTVSSVVAQLLRPHFDERDRPVSLFVLDIKAELYAVCARRLRELGYDVVAIAPWADKINRELGTSIVDVGFNPTLSLLTAGDDAKDQAESLGELLLPAAAVETGSSQHFLSFGREINAWGLLVLAQRGNPKHMNLVALRRLLMQAPEDLEALLAETAHCESFKGALKQVANKLVSTKLDSPEEWSGAINTATKALRVYDDFGPLGAHVSTTEGFQFSRIKDKPTCVFLIIPDDRLGTHGPTWLNMTMSVAIEQMARDRSTKRVLCLFDEFLNAGPLPNVLRALALYRGQGLQFAFYSQTGVSQVRRHYGDDGVSDFMEMCEVVQAFGVRGLNTLKMLSELAGQVTVRDSSANIQPDLMGGGLPVGFSTGATNQGQPLIRPEAIRTLPNDKVLTFYKNLPPLLLDKLNYLERPERKHADPNPYYRR